MDSKQISDTFVLTGYGKSELVQAPNVNAWALKLKLATPSDAAYERAPTSREVNLLTDASTDAGTMSTKRSASSADNESAQP